MSADLRQEEWAADRERDEGGQEELLEALVERLRAEGAPAGVWLVQISQVRRALQAADELLLEISDAILNQLPPLG